mmetsp:Transcript_31585/g.74320  ORF Transcript_31585/g.74320 Transcript_31585/m.74320 type:complete len:118 (+) Transcript_31585:338-691(+)
MGSRQAIDDGFFDDFGSWKVGRRGRMRGNRVAPKIVPGFRSSAGESRRGGMGGRLSGRGETKVARGKNEVQGRATKASTRAAQTFGKRGSLLDFEPRAADLMSTIAELVWRIFNFLI